MILDATLVDDLLRFISENEKLAPVLMDKDDENFEGIRVMVDGVMVTNMNK